MDVPSARSKFEQIIDKLTRAGVEFIVIGGRAENLFGSVRLTLDTELCYRRTRDNLVKLAAALRELKPTLRGALPDLPFRLDAEALALGCNYTFSTPLGDLDLLGLVEPIGDFDELARNAESVDLGGIPLKVISLNDLIRVKQHIQRSKDRDSLDHLHAIKRIREEQSREK